MDLQVFIGLSVDRKLFGGRDPASDALEALLDDSSAQLAAHLWPTIVAQGAPLRQLHVTCGLYDATDTSAPRARFRRQGEQLELELTVDWRPWLDRPAVDLAGHVVELVQVAIATALERNQQRTLAEACRAGNDALSKRSNPSKKRWTISRGSKKRSSAIIPRPAAARDRSACR